MTDETTTVVALLHDVVEDTDYTLKDLSDRGFSKEVTDALEHAEKYKKAIAFPED